MTQINTTSDMIRAIARAISERDLDILYKCENTNNDWLQSESERDAMDELIQSAMDAVEDLGIL